MTKLASLKSEKGDREKINLWLDHIKEFDQATRDEVLEQCKNDIEARKFYVKQFESMVDK